MLGNSFQSQRKQIKSSHRSLLPPTLTNSNLLSSQDHEEYISPAEFHELSQVQQKSCHSVNSHEPDKGDIEDVLMKMEYQNYLAQPETPKLPKYPSLRLEDQEIIVVEEQNQIGSDRGNNESVILEHIDFNEDKPHEDTPQWEAQEKDKFQHDGVNYVIHYVAPPSEDTGQEQEEGESCNPNDFSSYQFKNNRVRNSKQTEIVRTDSRDSDNLSNLKVANKSCIAKPMHDEKESQFSPTSQKQFDINNILNKWNQEIYPDLQIQYLDPLTSDHFKENKTKSLPFDMQRDAKYCVSHTGGSRYIQSSKDFQIQNRPNNSGVSNLSPKVQADSFGIKNNSKQGESVKSLKIKIQHYEQQTAKLLQRSKLQRQQVARLKEIVRAKDNQINSLKQNLQQTSQNLSKVDKTLMEESKRLQSKNRELTKQINDQNETLKKYESKHQILQKKLSQTVSFNQNSTRFFSSRLGNMNIQKFESFGQPFNKINCDHSHFNQKIEALQEHIFDLQQQNVGMELQIQKRVKMMSDHMELQLRKSINEEFRMMLTALKEQLGKQKQSNRILQVQKASLEQKWWSKERQLNLREEKVKKMYDELVIEWKDLQRVKKSPMQKQSSFPAINTINSSLSPKSINQQLNNNRSSQPFKSFDQYGRNFQANYFSNKDLTSTNPPKLSVSSNSNFQNNSSILKQYHFQSPQQKKVPYSMDTVSDSIGSYPRMTFGRENKSQKQLDTRELRGTDLRQTYDLSVINNKIQRLRKQINRELELIH